jgi:type IV secretory pathway VirB4 component
LTLLQRRPPGLRLPRHRGTTANLSSLYPWHTGPGPTQLGPYLGVNVTGGGTGWFYDPFELYGGALTDSNVLIAGRPGKGKSSAVKTFLYREIGIYGQRRFIAINDPKGEYTALGDRLGMPTIKLHPGGTNRLNPLDPAPGDRDDGGLLGRQRLVTGMLSVILERRLEPAEESLVAQSIAHLADRVERFDLGDLARVVGDPPSEVLGRAEFVRLSEIELRAAATPVRFAIGKLLDRTLRGMFDGQTTVRVDWEQGAGVVIDLSAVFQDREALPLVMMAATSWLQSAMTALASGRRGLQVDDEVWALLSNEWTVRHLQARLKLCRHWGICNVLICHKLSDLRAQAADGTAAHKLATGLLGDTGTRIFFQQAPDQVTDATELLGLSDEEARHLPRLVRGRALWRVGEHAAIVHHIVSPTEMSFCNTDQAMAA